MTGKKENDKIRKELFYKRENGYDLVTVDERVAVEDYCTGYARFLSDARTEREAVRLGIAEAESRGFREYRRGMNCRRLLISRCWGATACSPSSDQSVCFFTASTVRLEHWKNSMYRLES